MKGREDRKEISCVALVAEVDHFRFLLDHIPPSSPSSHVLVILGIIASCPFTRIRIYGFKVTYDRHKYQGLLGAPSPIPFEGAKIEHTRETLTSPIPWCRLDEKVMSASSFMGAAESWRQSKAVVGRIRISVKR